MHYSSPSSWCRFTIRTWSLILYQITPPTQNIPWRCLWKIPSRYPIEIFLRCRWLRWKILQITTIHHSWLGSSPICATIENRILDFHLHIFSTRNNILLNTRPSSNLSNPKFHQLGWLYSKSDVIILYTNKNLGPAIIERKGCTKAML